VTDEQKSYLQSVSDLRSWHRWQIGQAPNLQSEIML
jgi:hypothetical protein